MNTGKPTTRRRRPSRQLLLACCALLPLLACTEDDLNNRPERQPRPTATETQTTTGTTTETATETATERCVDSLTEGVEDLSVLDRVHTMKDAGSGSMECPGDQPAGGGPTPGGIDAISLARPAAATDKNWRVDSVDVLVAVPDDQFNSYPSDVRLTIHVWPLTDPSRGSQLGAVQSLTQTLNPGELQPEGGWTAPQSHQIGDLTGKEHLCGDLLDPCPAGTRCILAPPDTSSSGSSPNDQNEGEDANYSLGACFPDRPVRMAWWRFDFAGLIPAETGLSTAQYLVGVEWLSDEAPLVAASNFTLDCTRNWSDLRDGCGLKPVENPRTADDMLPEKRYACTWPMLRVRTSTLDRSGACAP